MFNRESLTQALVAVLMLNLVIMAYQYFFSSEDFSTIEPISKELIALPPSSSSQYIKVETDTLTVWIDRVGGRVAKASVVGASEPFFDRGQDSYLEAHTGYSGDANLLFSAPRSHYKMDGDTLVVQLNATDSRGLAYQKRFEFTKGSYEINVRSGVNNQSSKQIAVQPYFSIAGDKLTEKGQNAPSASTLTFDNITGASLAVRDYSGISYTSLKKSYIRTKFAKMKKADSVKTKGGWMAFQKHHYIAAWAFDDNTQYKIKNFWREGVSTEDSDKYEQQFSTQALAAATKLSPGEQVVKDSKLYVGPQSVPLLIKFSPTLRLTMDYGFFWMIANTLHKSLRLMNSYLPSLAACLIVLVALTKLAMYKFVREQMEQTEKIKAMQPEKAAIEARFEGQMFNPEKLEAMTALYKKHGVNSHSLSMLASFFQIPLMLAFYNMLQVAVEFKGQSFLWIPDLTMSDPYYIMPVLAAVTMMLHLSQTQDSGLQQEEFKLIFRLLPLMFLYMSLKWPAITTLYVVTNTAFSFAQDKVIKLQKAKQA